MHSLILLGPSPARRMIDFAGDLASALRRTLRPLAAIAGRLPAGAWPLFAVLATWPAWVWSVRRFGDGSDDPFGVVAAIVLATLLVVSRSRFTHRPRAPLLVASGVLAIASAACGALGIPDLATAVVATGAVVLALASIVDDDEPFAPYAGLALLSLPILASLQFYAGFPLRVITAEATRLLLSLGDATVERTGTALTVDGHLILVDAACSGVQMAWTGWFAACGLAWLHRLSNRGFLRRLPVVGLLVLAGNVVRNTVLVALEARGTAPGAAMHDAIGLAALALVLVGLVAVFSTCRDRVRVVQRVRVAARRRHGVRSGHSRVLVAVAFGVAAGLPVLHARADALPIARSVEWPSTFDGRPLVPLAMSPVEARFARGFPGAIARFANGDRLVVMREADRPTRKLHPAADCYRGLGYAIADEHLERDAEARLWRCFRATREGTGLRVCERITAPDGAAWTDASAWYWSALGSRGPWRAITVATLIGGRS